MFIIYGMGGRVAPGWGEKILDASQRGGEKFWTHPEGEGGGKFWTRPKGGAKIFRLDQFFFGFLKFNVCWCFYGF